MTANISFPLTEVLTELMDTSKSLSQPLFKLGQFARYTKNQELLEYINQELNGYTDFKDIPAYRKGRASLEVVLQIGYYKHNEKLPIELIDPEYRSVLKYVYIKEGIVTVEHLGQKSMMAENPAFYMPVPVTFLHILQEPARKLYKSDARISVVDAKLVSNPNLILEIPNAIRTKLLDFVNSIAEEFGYEIEIKTFNEFKEANNQTINNFMSTTITNSGDGNVINTGNKNNIENNAKVFKGDKDALHSELQKLGIEEQDITEIVEIVSEEEPNHEQGRLGPKANGWISNIMNKSLNGVGTLASGISVEILASLLKQFVGMS